jgi:hypothetical protein
MGNKRLLTAVNSMDLGLDPFRLVQMCSEQIFKRLLVSRTLIGECPVFLSPIMGLTGRILTQ